MMKRLGLALAFVLCSGPLQAQVLERAQTAPKTSAAPTTELEPQGRPQSSLHADRADVVPWMIDPAHSHIGFVARHLGFSKTRGVFAKFSASVLADPETAKLSSVEAIVETASVDTGIDRRDRHLRSDDFLNAEKFPQLKLVTKRIKWRGRRFTADVELTIRDVSKPVTFKGELLGLHKVDFGQGEQLRAGYEATATIDRKDFGLSWNMVTEGLAVVADAVQIELAAELSYSPGPNMSAARPPEATTATALAAKPKALRPLPSAGPRVPEPHAPAAPLAPQAPAIGAPNQPTAPSIQLPTAAR